MGEMIGFQDFYFDADSGGPEAFNRVFEKFLAHWSRLAVPEGKALVEKLLPFTRKFHNEEQRAHLLRIKGSFSMRGGDAPTAIRFAEEARAIFHALGKPAELIHCNNQLARVYADLGDFTKALEFLIESLHRAEECGNRQSESNTLNAMSSLYQRMENAEKAEDCARRCVMLSEELGDPRTIGISHVNLGNAFGMTKDWLRAIGEWEIALPIFENLGDAELVSSVLGNLGIACDHLGDFKKAEEYLLRCFAIKKEAGSQYDVARSLQNLATVNISMKRYGKALEYCREGLALAEQFDARSLEFQLWREMAEACKGLGDFENALRCFEKYHALEKELFTEEMRMKTDTLRLRFDIEKSEKEKEIYRLKNIDLAEANEKITSQKEEIEQKNKDITDSIRYAKRIQEALLPQENSLLYGFDDAFVFYLPRDIVSGDFYWSLPTREALLFAAADCTGHGVPGALMSVMSASFLSEIVSERGVTDPGEAMNLLRLKVITALHGKGDGEPETRLRDGMDMILCRYEPASRLLQFACANNPLWLLREGALIEFAADKFPVGLHYGQLQYFRTQQATLQPGDRVFLFTDGFADQFGGAKGKKFGYKQLRESLLKTQHLSMRAQKDALSEIFHQWQGAYEQVDDVLLMGVSVK